MVRRSVLALVVLVGAVALVATGSRGQQVGMCPGNCAEVSVGGGEGAPGSTVDLPVRFRQGPSDGVTGGGNDDVAAIAMTIGLGGTNLPLTLADCNDNDRDGLPDAIRPGADIEEEFRLVIENVECPSPSAEERLCGCRAGINRCLCPGNGQTRDNFVNVVVYGPKEIPTEGGVVIPRLPDNAELLRMRLRITGGADESPIPITVFAETDSTPKPQFGAFLSIGDLGAVDVTAQGGISRVNVINGSVTILPGGCVGDCDGDGQVNVNELVLGVDILMGNRDLSACEGLDLSGNGSVEVDELLKAVDDALDGCQ
jgi:hypothetical protein